MALWRTFSVEQHMSELPEFLSERTTEEEVFFNDYYYYVPGTETALDWLLKHIICHSPQQLPAPGQLRKQRHRGAFYCYYYYYYHYYYLILLLLLCTWDRDSAGSVAGAHHLPLFPAVVVLLRLPDLAAGDGGLHAGAQAAQ